MRVSTLLTLLPALAFATSFDAGVNSAPSACKVLPGDAEWPADSVWKSEIRGIEKNVVNDKFKHPQWRLEASKPEHVISAVKFAKKHNVRLSILNSGHDFNGRNDAPSGLVLVVRDFKGARLSPSFTATEKGVEPVTSKSKVVKLPKQQAQAYLTFGSGLNIKDVTNLLAPSGLFALGAAHKSVSIAGGWGQTAGHAPLSAKYGLGADQFVEFKVVTADGELKVANEVANPDLFWALRGGGGGAWGVVTEATIKVHPSPKMASTAFYLNTTDFNDKKSIWPVAAYMHQVFPEFAEKGLTVYYYLYPNAISVFSTSSDDLGTKAAIDSTWGTVLKKMTEMPGMNSSAIYVSYDYPDYQGYFKASFDSMAMKKRDYGSMFYKRHGPGEDGETQARGIVSDYSDSWLLGKEHLQSPKLAAALEEGLPKDNGAQWRGQMIGGGMVSKLGNGTSVLPAWRTMYVHTIASASSQPNVTALRAIAPEMGAYSNECARKSTNWRKAFFGSNYERLSQIKTKYDPDNLFWVTPGVNADQWEVKEGRVCKSDNLRMQALSSPYASAPLTDNTNVINVAEIADSDDPKFPVLYQGAQAVMGAM